MTGLKITTGKPQMVLPADEAVTRSFGILGMRGSGKSNAAVVLAEEMWKAGDHWVAIDPKGDWYGMRSSSDGKGPGLPVVVFGGEHQDVALQPTAAAGVEVADAILGDRITCILDLSEFTKGEKIEFLAGRGNREGFASRLYRKKKREAHDPIHVFLEEAHDYVPQKATGEVGKLVDDVSRFQTMGRQRGFGVSVLSQRSARVHKDVLNQIDTLFAMRTVAPLDRDAIEEWVKGHGVSKELVASLPELEDGEAWLWSPEWLKKIERIQFRRRGTYDSGATPVRGAKRRPRVVLADVDLKALEERMAAAVEQAKESDPEHLQRQLREARTQLAKRPTETRVDVQEVEKVVEERVEVPILEKGQVAELRRASTEMVKGASGLKHVVKELRNLNGAAEALVGAAESIKRSAQSIDASLERAQLLVTAPVVERRRGHATRTPTRTRTEPVARPQPARAAATRTPAVTPDGDFSPTSSQQRILDSLAWFEAVGIPEPRRPALAFVAQTRPTSGGFKNNLGALRSAGLIDYPVGSRVALTEAGRALSVSVDIPPTTGALQEEVLRRVTMSQAAILEALIKEYPDALVRENLADRVGVPVTSGGFKNNLGALRSFQLIDYPAPGFVVALSVLFLENG